MIHDAILFRRGIVRTQALILRLLSEIIDGLLHFSNIIAQN